MNTPQQILERYWGYPSFRPLQEEIISGLMAGRDALALLPTGGGKSLCYQVPGLLLDGLTLVVSPLIALMQDQVLELKSRGIRAAALYSGMRYHEVKQTLDNVLQGAYTFLYVSPERLQTQLFKDYLPGLPMSLIAVDEAHCISQWGQDFRPEYRSIGTLREEFPEVPVLALTATATPVVETDIIQQLALRQPAVFRQSFERKNIFFRVHYSENKPGDLLKALQGRQDGPGSSIVYCRSRKQTEWLAAHLADAGIRAVAYHAGMNHEVRSMVSAAWLNNEQDVIVATSAFGMGINKPDVRQVIHYDVPEQPEAFYQEAGRAGRDGLPARSLLLYNESDLRKLEASTALQYPPLSYLVEVYQSVAEYLQVAVGMAPDRYYDFELRDFCEKFRLDPFAATYALRLLAREGLWTLSDAVFSPATVHVTAERETIDDLQQRYPEVSYLLTVLLRLYQGILYHPVPVRLAAIARQARTSKEVVHAGLLQLQAMGLVDYEQPKDGPQLYFHHERVESKHLLLDVQRIRILREEHEKRIAAMMTYLRDARHCRTRQLLAYFGEEGRGDCGHCDYCSAQAGSRIKNPAAQVLQVLQPGQAMTVPDILRFFGEADHAAVLQELRRLVDEKQLRLLPDGTLQRCE